MLKFLKKLIGLSTTQEIEEKKQSVVVPYKIETPIVNNKTGDVVESTSSNNQSDNLTPPKKARKPRSPNKVNKLVKEKATKSAAKKTSSKSLNKI